MNKQTETFGKFKALLTEYHLNKMDNQLKPFGYYTKKYNITYTTITKKLVDAFLTDSEIPNDKQIEGLLDIIRKEHYQRIRGSNIDAKKNDTRVQTVEAKPEKSSELIPNLKPANDSYPELKKYSCRQIIDELRKRGYVGELVYTHTIHL